MRIIICGYGLIGKFLISYFSSLNLSITLVEKDKEKVEEAKLHHEILVIEGEILNHQILQFANVGSSNLFIACSDSDSVNVVACQLVKKWVVSMLSLVSTIPACSLWRISKIISPT